MSRFLAVISALLVPTSSLAFTIPRIHQNGSVLRSAVSLQTKASSTDVDGKDDRRQFLKRVTSGLLVTTGLASTGGTLLSSPQAAQATVYLDPAMYGDQELRVSAVDSLRESVRRAMLQNPTLTAAFYKLAILDGLSYDENSKDFGPDGRIVRAVLSAKDGTPGLVPLKEAANSLIDSTIKLKKLSSITVADCVALAGAEAIESIGGPVVSVQLGRGDAAKNAPLSPLPPLDLLDGGANSNTETIVKAFRRSGLSEREMVSLLGGLLTIEKVQATVSPMDAKAWKQSEKGKYRERGKIGRMSEFKRLTDEDIQEAEEDEFDERTDDEDVYIADTFGTRDEAFGKRVGGSGVDKQSFNKYLAELDNIAQKKKGAGKMSDYGWIGTVLTDNKSPTSQAYLTKYGKSNLNYIKDFSYALNYITQVGGEYTGGKYENLLKNSKKKPPKDTIDSLL